MWRDYYGVCVELMLSLVCPLSVLCQSDETFRARNTASKQIPPRDDGFGGTTRALTKQTGRLRCCANGVCILDSKRLFALPMFSFPEEIVFVFYCCCCYHGSTFSGAVKQIINVDKQRQCNITRAESKQETNDQRATSEGRL